MVMKAQDVVSLCRRSAAAIREDMALVVSGELTFHSRSQGDVTDWHLARMRSALSCIQDVIDGCGCDCA